MMPLFLAFLAGAIGALGFEPLGLWPLTLFAFAGLLWLIERAPHLRSALARGWWFGVGHFCVGLNWIATAFTYQAAMPAWLGWVAVLLLSLYLAVYPAAAAGIAFRWGKGRPLSITLILAAAWIVTEWMRANLFTGFAWNPASVVLIDRSVAPLSALVGTYGLSALVILFAGLIRIAAIGPDRRPALWLAGFALVAVVMAELVAPNPQGEPGPAVRIVQPNIGQETRWSAGASARNMARLAALSRATAPPSDTRLLLWPESAVTEPLQDGRVLTAGPEAAMATRREVAAAARGHDWLLAGGITIGSENGRTAATSTNSVFLVAPGGQLAARYDKAHLVPYGEYLPMRTLLSAIGLSRLAPGDLDFRAGPGPRNIAIPGIGPVGIQICYEIIFSGEVVDPAQRPAFIFNPSNDAWFGAWGPPQHLAQARLRALEEGLPVLRATPTGISAIIDSRGRLVETIPLGVAGVIDGEVPPSSPPTVFALWGNGLAFAFALFLAALGIAAWPRRAFAIEPGSTSR